MIRRLLLGLFEHLNIGDITIRHHWTGDKLLLHSFRHRDYWFHARNRKRRAMELFGRLLGNGDCVLDLGGHIGYAALYLSQLVGDSGQVYVFEPSPENLTYLRRNIASSPRHNVHIIEKAVSDRTGTTSLAYESFSGQNSTISAEFEARYPPEFYRSIEVPTLTIDEFVGANELRPRFIKMDVEGAEFQALSGMLLTLANSKPRLMVEINLQPEAVVKLLNSVGYVVYDECGTSIVAGSSVQLFSNLFAFHVTDEPPTEMFS